MCKLLTCRNCRELLVAGDCCVVLECIETPVHYSQSCPVEDLYLSVVNKKDDVTSSMYGHRLLVIIMRGNAGRMHSCGDTIYAKIPSDSGGPGGWLIVVGAVELCCGCSYIVVVVVVVAVVVVVVVVVVLYKRGDILISILSSLAITIHARHVVRQKRRAGSGDDE